MVDQKRGAAAAFSLLGAGAEQPPPSPPTPPLSDAPADATAVA